MKRDMDVIRQMLLLIEAEGPAVGEYTIESKAFPTLSPEEVWGHIRLLEEAGFISEARQMFGGGETWQAGSITWEGNEYLDKVRDPEVWKKTKAIAAQAGGGGLKLMGDIAAQVISASIVAAVKLQG